MTGSLKRLLRYVDTAVAGMLYASNRTMLARGRVCVGCREGAGVRCYDALGWVCESCEEVIEIVYEIEIERTREACVKLGGFIEDLGRGR